jgi:hypothetical protein
MYTPSKEVTERLNYLHGLMVNKSYRRLARILGYDETFAPSLASIAKGRPGSISKANESVLKRRIGIDSDVRIIDMKVDDLRAAIINRYVVEVTV